MLRLIRRGIPTSWNSHSQQEFAWPVDFLFNAIRPHCIQAALIFFLQINWLASQSIAKRLSIQYDSQCCTNTCKNVNTAFLTIRVCIILHRITFIQLTGYKFFNSHLLRVAMASWLVYRGCKAKGRGFETCHGCFVFFLKWVWNWLFSLFTH